MSTATALASRDKPFLPSDLDVGRALRRTFAAHVLAALDRDQTPSDIARARFPRDQLALALVERSATSAASTTQSGWASQLVAQATGAFLASLQPSAAASLIAAGTRFSLEGLGQINLPTAQTGSVTATFVAEGAPIPIAQGITTSVPLLPAKLAIGAVLTREIAEHSAEDATTTIEMILRDSTRIALDGALFGSAAAGVGPAGLLHGVTATTASTAAAGSEAALSDARALVDACVTGGGGTDVRFFCSPGRAMALKSYMDESAPPIYGSVAIPGTQLIAIDVAAFASGFDAVPRVEASLEAVVHMEGASPQQIGTPGSPNVVAAPVRSVYSTDCIAVKVVMRCGWAMRCGAIAHIDSAMQW